MTDPADLVIRNAEIHTLAPSGDEIHDAVAVRDGEIVRVADEYEIDFLEGVETTVYDVGGRVVTPGLIDAHTHLTSVGRYEVHADLRSVDGPAEAVDRLAAQARDTDGWIQGYGFDESTWAESRYLRRDDLDQVSETRPVLAVREDGHTAAVNSPALDRLEEALPEADIQREGGSPTGVIVEEAVDVVRDAVAPDREETRELVLAARDIAHERGITGIHDMVRDSHAPAVYRSLAVEEQLALRVRLNYWSNHLPALTELGLTTNHGSAWVQTGAIKSFTDGSFGGRTAKVSEPYADGDGTGQWVVEPAELDRLIEQATEAGFQVTVHAIGDEAVKETLAVFDRYSEPGDRHRIEHVELADDAQVSRFEEIGAVASMQPNFLKWARDGGLYETRLGPERTAKTDRLGVFNGADVPLALGSDCMPMDPLFGIMQAVTAPYEDQQLSVTEAFRGYTYGAAYAGFDEDRLGSIESGKLADMVILEGDPWESPAALENTSVAATIVDGEVTYGDPSP